jgi:hypothetical protein
MAANQQRYRPGNAIKYRKIRGLLNILVDTRRPTSNRKLMQAAAAGAAYFLAIDFLAGKRIFANVAK